MNARQTFPAFACTLALLAAGCAGGSGANATLPATAQNVRAASKATMAHAVIRIHIPRAPHRSRGLRGRFVSPATQALTISTTGPTQLSETVAVTPSSPNCSSTLAGTTCSIPLQVAPGSYTVTIVALDAVPPAPTHTLSAAQSIPMTVSTGAVNSVNLTLSGVPAQIVVAPGSRLSLRNVNGGIDLLGTGSRPLLVEALDAGGNIIVGPGSPSFTVAQTSGALGVTIVQPLAASPNTFFVTPPSALSAATATLAATASFAGQATDGCAPQYGGVCSASVTLSMHELLATLGFNTVVVFEVGASVPLATVSAGVGTNVGAIAFDPGGDLLVANCYAGCGNGNSADVVAVYAPPYTGVPAMMATGIQAPRGMGFDSNGNLFVSECGSCVLGVGDSVVEYAPPFTAASAPLGTTTIAVNRPTVLAFDASNDMFVANQGNVREYVPPYTGNPVATIGGNTPTGVAVDKNANLFIAFQNTQVVDVAVPPYSAVHAIMANGVKLPIGLGLDGSGNLFVANGSGNTVSEFTPPYTNLSSPAVSISSGISGPNAIVVDATGNVFVGNGNSGQITQYVSPYTGAPAFLNPQTTPNQLAILP